MAKRRSEVLEGKVTRRSVRREDEPEPIASEPEYFDLDENVARFLAERGEGVTDAIVKVYKAGGIGANGGRNAQPNVRDAFLYECAPDEFNETQLQASYGQGAYRIKMYGTNAEGAFGLLVNKTLEIGPAPAWRKPEAPAPTLNGVPIHVNGGGGDIAQAIAQVLAPVLAQLSNVPKAPTRGEMLAEMTAMASLFKSDIPRAVDPIEQLTKLAPVLALLGGKGVAGEAALDSESGPYAVLMKGLETLAPAFQEWMKNQGNGAQNAATQKALPAPAAAAAEAPTETEEEKEMNLALRGQLTMLLMAAKTNGNPETYAAMIYEQAPDSVIAMLEAPNWFEELTKISADFAQVKEWCEKVRALILEDLKADREEEAAEAAAVAARTGPGAAEHAGNGALPQTGASGTSVPNARKTE